MTMKRVIRRHHSRCCRLQYLFLIVWIHHQILDFSPLIISHKIAHVVTAWILQSRPHIVYKYPIMVDQSRRLVHYHPLRQPASELLLQRTDQTQMEDVMSQQQKSASNYSKRKQRIAIIGTGAVGSYYGARLWEIGHDVHFLLRNENYRTATQEGLQITSVVGNILIPPQQLKAYPTTQDMAKVLSEGSYHNDPDTNASFDWVIVALKSSSLDAIPDLVVPLLNANTTRVLVIMNGMIENDLLNLMKLKTGQHAMNNTIYSRENEPLQCCHTWYGGMALICCNRIASCHIDHTYFGLLTAGVASTKDQSLHADARNGHAFRELFQGSKIDVAFDTSLLRGRWSKMIWNLPFNGISVAMGGITVDKIVNDRGLRQLAYNIMDETILAANTDLQQHYGENNFIPLGEKERAAMMKLSDDMGPYKPSTMLDFIHRRSMEVRYLFRTPLDRAKLLNVSTPYLETVVLQIEAYQRMYNLQ